MAAQDFLFAYYVGASTQVIYKQQTIEFGIRLGAAGDLLQAEKMFIIITLLS